LEEEISEFTYGEMMRVALYLNHLDEEYQISLYRGIKQQAIAQNVELLTIQGETLNFPDIKKRFPSTRFTGMDGILFLSSVLLNESDRMSIPDLELEFSGIPTLSIGNRLLNFPSIIIKARKPMEELMEHLLYHHGYRKFLFIGGPVDHRDNMVREHIFRRYINSLQKEFPELTGVVTNGGFNEVSGMEIVKEYVKDHPEQPLDAIVCANDTMAIGAMKALQTQNNPQWKQCAVTGFDDIPQARHEVPGLTTIHQPLETMGKLALQTMVDMLQGKKIPDVIPVDSYLCIRESCGCPKAKEQKNNDPSNNTDLIGLRNYLSRIQYQAIKSENHMRSVSYFGQSLVSIASLKELITALGPMLDSLENNYFCLLIYPDPVENIPEMAHLLYERDSMQERFSLDFKEEILLKDYFAKECFKHKNQSSSRTMYHLISGNEILGIVVYEAKDHAHPYMCSSTVFIANAIKMLHVLDDEKERSRLLENQVRMRTRDLEISNRKLTMEANRRIAVEAEVLRISELERQRFSQDLHDDICQRLAGISMFSKSLNGSKEGLIDLSEMIDETLQRTRQYAHDSFPVELDSLGLDEALERLCISIEKQTGCKIEYKWKIEKPSPFNSKEKINLYRIAQEALSNVMKHSKADRAEVIISRDRELYMLSIRDYGIGLSSAINENPKKAKARRGTGLGHRSMEYRAHQLNADFVMQSAPDMGTLVEVHLQPGSENTDTPLKE